MTAASALATGVAPSAQLAAAAVREALARAGLAQARGVFLFLSSDFARQPQPAILAAARAAGCLQVAGLVAPGVFNESGWVLDRPAAAALVLGGRLGLGPAADAEPLVAFSAGPALPPAWASGRPRCGLGASGTALWQDARLAPAGAEAAVVGARCRLALSTGLRRLGPAQAVERAHGHDLCRVGGQTALASLLRALPPELRGRSPLPLHLLGARRESGLPMPIPLLAANADGSLTLAERLLPGEAIVWTLRQPLAAEADMESALAGLATASPEPSFALMFSCIGRGPLFYGDDDRDLALLRRRFPGLPVAGAYGSGQIAPLAGGNRALHNCVVTALYEVDSHV